MEDCQQSKIFQLNWVFSLAKLILFDFRNHYKLFISSAVKLQGKSKNYGMCYYSCYLRCAFVQIKTEKEGNFFSQTLCRCVHLFIIKI